MKADALYINRVVNVWTIDVRVMGVCQGVLLARDERELNEAVALSIEWCLPREPSIVPGGPA